MRTKTMAETRVDPTFDPFIDLNEVIIGQPQIGNETIVVPVSNLAIWPGHPTYPEGKLFPKCRLVFENAASSVRTIYEYVGTRTGGFKPERTVIDGPFVPKTGKVFQYLIEGVSEELNAWVSWKIESVSYRIEQ